MHQDMNGKIVLENLLARGRSIYLVDLLWRTTERYGRDECPIYAAAVAFSLLLSLFPLLIVFVAVFGLLTALPGFGPWVTQFTADRAPGESLRQLVESISGVPVVGNSVAGFVGLAALVWAASGMFGALRQGLNRAFGIASPPQFIRARAQALAGVGVLFLVGLLSVVLTTVLIRMGELVSRLVAGWMSLPTRAVVDWLIPYTTLVSVALLLYVLIPNHNLQTRELWPAALISGTGLYLTIIGFTYYVSHFAQFQQVYGALAGAVALLIFLNLNATIILFGAGLAAELARDRHRATA